MGIYPDLDFIFCPLLQNANVEGRHFASSFLGCQQYSLSWVIETGWNLAWGRNCLASEMYWLFRRKYRLFGSTKLYWMNQQYSGQVAISFPVGIGLIYTQICGFIEQLPALESHTIILRDAKHLDTNKISAWTHCDQMVHLHVSQVLHQITSIFYSKFKLDAMMRAMCLNCGHFYRLSADWFELWVHQSSQSELFFTML